MTEIPSQFKFKTKGKANPDAIVRAFGVRFTLLTSRFIRLEFCPLEEFEDRPSQIFWFRDQPVPDFTVERNDNGLEINTEYLLLRYKPEEPLEPFKRENLTIFIKEHGVVWEYGLTDQKNLGGTLRTLDNVDGSSPLEPGLVSRSGWSVINDTKGLIFNNEGWLEARSSPPLYEDFYFLGYGSDFRACMKDYYKIAGQSGLVPRWVLGNWWSRYWEYSDLELRNLLLDFRDHEIPLSVCIIDMDWHITRTGNQSSGWTGYTWNKDLFPEPAETVKFIHDLGLKTGLNLHPAGGIYPHEEMYSQMANAMAINPTSGEPIPFEPENPEFVVPYFKFLHHPQEETVGIDFWWMDWQQGNPNKLPGLNLLWWINHLHYFDAGRDRTKRSFLFSRWGGLGNHRYPIGFSGDTIISWDSLAFQPYLTATAANVGFGWWSHDIGGHMGGITDNELYARWVQLGVFSPVLRLHSTKNPFLERRPWGYDLETYQIVKESMQLRHELVPYLYSMAWRDHADGIVLIRPMYYQYPENEQAYVCPNQYLFGSELIAAPYIESVNHEIGLTRQLIWFPQGVWFNFFNGNHITVENTEGCWKVLYGDLHDIPVYAKAGAIIPLANLAELGGVDLPSEITLRIFPGANNSFLLYEDDGSSSFYQDGIYAISKYSQQWGKGDNGFTLSFTIHPVKGETSILPGKRSVNLEFEGIQSFGKISLIRNGKLAKNGLQYRHMGNRVKIHDLDLDPGDLVELKLFDISSGYENVDKNDTNLLLFDRLIGAFRLDNNVKRVLQSRKKNIFENVNELLPLKMSLTSSQMRSLVEIILESGVEYSTSSGKEEIVIWNNNENPYCTWTYMAEQAVWENPYHIEQGQIPAFRVIEPQVDLEQSLWGHDIKFTGMVQIDYGPLLRGIVLLNPKGKEKTEKIRWQ